MRYSIRKRLLILLLLIISIVGTVSLIGSYYSARHEVQELFDAQLAQSTRVLRAMLMQPIRSGRTTEVDKLLTEIPLLTDKKLIDHGFEPQHGHEYESKIAFQVWKRPGELIFHSSSAPVKGFSHEALVSGQFGYSDELIDGKLWRVFSLPDKSNSYVFKAGELYDVRNELIHGISLNLMMSSIIGIIILAILIWVGIGRGLLPLNNIAREVTQRTPRYLSDIDMTEIPLEIIPLVTSLNDLFKRVDASLESERRFTDDAAHELRTPLAALKTQVQVALRSDKKNEQQQSLDKIVSGVDRATHLVEQLLELARSQGEQYHDGIKSQQVVLYDACSQAIANTLDATKNDVNIVLSGDKDIIVMMNIVGLSVLLRNILDNAVRYSPDNSEIDVKIKQQNNQVELTVTDHGPGIPSELQERVFDRFYRVPGTKKTGSGLGLAIAKQIALSNNVTMNIHNNSSSEGLVVTLVFNIKST